MKNRKRGQAGTITALFIFLGSLLVVTALTNSTNETLTNITFENQTTELALANETNQTAENSTSINNSDFPADNLISNTTLPEKPEKNLTETVERHKGKFNNETEEYLKKAKDKKEEKEFIIKFRNSVDEEKLANVSVEKSTAKLAKIRGKIEDIGGLIEDSEIEFIELEQNVSLLEESIPFNIEKTNAPNVWNTSNGSGVKVAILDTGIGLHDDLLLYGGTSFVDNNYWDSHGHGTQVAGIVAALLNDNGLVGVSPTVELYSVKIMQSSTGDLSNAIAGVEWAIDNDIDIVLMSFGIESYSQIFKEALEEAYAEGILLVAASGNEGADSILYPAKYDSVIAVGAITQNDELAYFSSYGFEQELVAPGVGINSTTLGNSYGIASGTSLAAPHVAGVAALIKSSNNSLTNTEIRNKLRNDALDLGQEGKDDYFGYGLVQIKLDSFNFTQANESYFYEIFNITDFRLPNETYSFWVDGVGTIDDVNFLQGYYLVNVTFNDGKKKSNIYNVSENGSIFILSTSAIHTDNFHTEGGTESDNIAWVNDYLTVKTSSTVNTPEAECYRIDGGAPGNQFNYCYFDTPGHETECDSNDPDIACGSYTTCTVGSLVDIERDIIDYSSARSGSSSVRVTDDCTDVASTSEEGSGVNYYVANTKRTRCLNSTNYVYEAYYSNNNWVTYKTSTCSSPYICQDQINYTTKTATMLNPCVSPNTCTGTIQAITEDRNGNPMSNLLVTRDLVSNKTTNIVGAADYSLTQICNQDMEFKVYCTNTSSATLCGTQTAKLDVINDYEGLLFDCSICSSSPDLQIDVDNIRTNKAAGLVTVNISLSGSVAVNNSNITFKVQGSDGLIAREASQLFNINTGESFKSIIQSITLNENDDFVHVYVDTANKVSESNEKNNYALVPLFKKELKVYFDVNTGYTPINNEIKDYLKLFVNEETIQNNADVTLCVGKKCSNFDSLNSFTTSSTLKSQNFGYKNNKIIFEGKDVGTNKPYNAIVGGFWNDLDGKKYIMAYGIDIDGDIAAVKKLISARELFLNKDLLYEERTKVIDDLDLTGISVIDLLQNSNNFPYYSQRNSTAFANVVARILNNNNFEISIKTVKTTNDNTTLRLKNINTDYSNNFKDAIINNTKPVVLSRGIHSNLLTWNNFGKELAFDEKAARDTWLIEMVGGPTIDEECSPNGQYNCPNYTFSDLKTYYWPALITGVQNYSAQKKLDYVGFSLGCSVALESLELYGSSGKANAGYVLDSQTGNYLSADLSANPVDTFVAVACPGNFTELTTFIKLFNMTKDDVFGLSNLLGIDHIRGGTYRQLTTVFKPKVLSKDPILHARPIWSLLFWAGFITKDDNKMSKNIYDDFYTWINDPAQPDLGKNVQLNNALIIQGKSSGLSPLTSGILIPSSVDKNSDLIVPAKDMKILCENINSTNKYYLSFDAATHAGLFTSIADKSKVQEQIKFFLKEGRIDQDEKNYRVNQNCELI